MSALLRWADQLISDNLPPVETAYVPAGAAPDPVSLDATRPFDLDSCPVCIGDGAIDMYIHGEWTAEPCWSCHGTGQRGAA